MPKYMCPACGSEYFVTSKIGPKTILNVTSERSIQIIQAAPSIEVNPQSLFCGACSWLGRLADLVESQKD